MKAGEALEATERENLLHQSTAMDPTSLERPDILHEKSPGCDRQGSLSLPGDREITGIRQVATASQNDVTMRCEDEWLSAQ